MKKAIAFLTALTAAFSLFTACGNKNDSEPEGDRPAVSDTADKADDAEEVTEAENAAETEAEKEAEIEIVSESPADKDEDKADVVYDETDGEEYLALLNKFLSSMAEEDGKAFIACYFPQTTVKAMESIGDGDIPDDTVGDVVEGGFNLDKSKKVTFISARDGDETDRLTSERMYSYLDVLYSTMVEKGISADALEAMENDDNEEMPAEVIELFDEVIAAMQDATENAVKFTTFKEVMFEVDGEEFLMTMYIAEGEDQLKIDMNNSVVMDRVIELFGMKD